MSGMVVTIGSETSKIVYRVSCDDSIVSTSVLNLMFSSVGKITSGESKRLGWVIRGSELGGSMMFGVGKGLLLGWCCLGVVFSVVFFGFLFFLVTIVHESGSSSRFWVFGGCWLSWVVLVVVGWVWCCGF